jgi:hypothetical protein
MGRVGFVDGTCGGWHRLVGWPWLPVRGRGQDVVRPGVQRAVNCRTGQVRCEIAHVDPRAEAHDGDPGFCVVLAAVKPSARTLLNGSGVARRHQELVAADEGALAGTAWHVLDGGVTLEQARHGLTAFQVHGYSFGVRAS